MKGHAKKYSEAELAWVKRNRGLSQKELHLQFCERFQRKDISIDNLKRLRWRKGWKTGRNGKFVPGQVPPNKGKKRPYNANSASTYFKKGHAPANQNPIGHERIDAKDGYCYIKIDEINPHTGFQGHYVHKHRHLWEKANGSIPEDMVLKCLDGDKLNTDPSNWKCIDRAMLPRLNGRFGRGYDKAPTEIKPTIMVIAELEHKTRTIRKVSKNDA